MAHGAWRMAHGAWRMAQTAAHLVDHVIPHVPVRQRVLIWVMRLPIPLRLRLAAQPKLVTRVLKVVHRVITRHLLDQAGLKADEADGGAVTLIQRFGSAANLNIHLHCLVLNSVYRRGTDGAPEFVDASAPTDEAPQTVLLRPLQAAACTCRIACGPRAGQKVLTLQGAMPRETDFKQMLCADIDGVSLHAAVRCGADDRQALEQLCRYITRPALANERLQTNAAGRVVLKLKTPWRDGSTHLVMSPLAFMQRLAALVPRPRLHLIRFGIRITSLREASGPPLREHGVLAPNAKLRAMVVPQGPEPAAQAAQAAQCEANCAQDRKTHV